ncbi:sodium:solute symporter family protein [soil metagenome]
MTLAPLDWTIVALFLAGILWLGFSARSKDASVLSFLSAGRALTLPFFVATLVTTWYGGILGIGESVSYYGVGTWLLLGVPYYVFAAVYAAWLAPRVREATEISIPERIARRFGPNSGLAAAALLFLLAVPAAHALMLGTLLRTLVPLPLAIAVPIATLFATLFLYKGGLLADVRAGTLAFVGMYVGFAAILLVCLAKMPLATMWAALPPASRSFTGGQNVLAILSFFILGAWTIADPGFHQRVSSAESPASVRKGVLVSIGFWCLFDLLSIGTGLYALALLHPLPKETLTIFPALGEAVLPPGLKGLFLCGMTGTILSALVGYTLVAGASFGREIVGRLRKMDDNEVKAWTRGGFVLSTLVAIALALAIDSVVALWYAWAGAVVGAVLLPMWFSYRGSLRLPDKAVAASMTASFLVSASWLAYGRRTNNDFLEVILWGQRFGLGTLAPGLVVSAVVLGLGWLAARRESI